jgi:hypothetical protein
VAILTVEQLREHIESPLEDDALQRLLDGTEDLIVRHAGASGSITELLGGSGAYLTTSRPISSVTSIVERHGETDAVTLAADDYRLINAGGYVIQRRSGGTNSRYLWNPWTQIVYTATDDADLRVLVQLGLIEIESNVKPGITMRQIGSWTEQYNAGTSRDDLIDDCLSLLDPAPSMTVIG